MKISPTQKQHVRTEINERKDWPHLCLSYRPLFCISQEKKLRQNFLINRHLHRNLSYMNLQQKTRYLNMMNKTNHVRDEPPAAVPLPVR
jgi:hypothetical protein